MKKIQIILFLAFLSIYGLIAQSTGDNAGPNRWNSTYTQVTKTATTWTTYTTNVNNIHCVNTSGSDATLTIADNNSHTYFPAVTVAAAAPVFVVNYGETGVTYKGLKLSGSSDTAIFCQVTGKQ